MRLFDLFINKKTLCLYFLSFIISCTSVKPPLNDNETSANALTTIPHAPLAFNERIDRITFGSCNDQDKAQPLWTEIEKMDANLWIWLGDNIYADTDNPAQLEAMYNKQLANDSYSKFVSQVPVIGIWDDHDYGVNNGGKEYAGKDVTKQWMLDFLQVPQQAEVRKRAGAYQSYAFGEDDTQVKIILLDSRYFRDAPIRENGQYIPNETGTILGEAQWTWLDNELKNSTAKIHIIANGIQVLHEDHAYEKWANFPNERKRLLDLLADYQVNMPILLSGDRHIAEFARLEHKGVSIVEVTASGLTHSYDSLESETNRHRIGELITSLNYGCMLIDWSAEIPEITLQIRGINNNLLDELRF